MAKKRCTEFQVVVNMNASLGAASAKICARYSTTYTHTAASYSVLGASSAEVFGPIGSSNATASVANIGTVTSINAAARTVVYIGCFGLDGDGAADPSIGQILFRRR